MEDEKKEVEQPKTDEVSICPKCGKIHINEQCSGFYDPVDS